MKYCHLIDTNNNWCFCVVEVRLFTGTAVASITILVLHERNRTAVASITILVLHKRNRTGRTDRQTHYSGVGWVTN
jgi:hypothetical protein